jgi:hypothetical protein
MSLFIITLYVFVKYAAKEDVMSIKIRKGFIVYLLLNKIKSIFINNIRFIKIVAINRLLVISSIGKISAVFIKKV